MRVGAPPAPREEKTAMGCACTAFLSESDYANTTE